MPSYKEIYTEEVEKGFAMLDRSPFKRTSKDAVPQEGQMQPLVPFGLNGQDVFDSTDTMDLLWYIPDVVLQVVDARVVLSFREFFSSATTVASGGGSTSGASSASSSGSSSALTTDASDHTHAIAEFSSGTPGSFSKRRYTANGPDINLETSDLSPIETSLESTGGLGAHVHTIPHTHGIAHDHTTPAHAHELSYGVHKEALPGSHSVNLSIYKWDDVSAWTLLATITSLTAMIEDVDLNDYVTTSGKYRLSLQSAAAQPQGGRLGADVAGYAVCAIAPR